VQLNTCKAPRNGLKWPLIDLQVIRSSKPAVQEVTKPTESFGGGEKGGKPGAGAGAAKAATTASKPSAAPPKTNGTTAKKGALLPQAMWDIQYRITVYTPLSGNPLEEEREIGDATVVSHTNRDV